MSEYENDAFDDASMVSGAKQKPKEHRSKKKPPSKQISQYSNAESVTGGGEDDEELKIDSNQMFKIDFSHLENIMQGF